MVFGPIPYVFDAYFVKIEKVPGTGHAIAKCQEEELCGDQRKPFLSVLMLKCIIANIAKEFNNTKEYYARFTALILYTKSCKYIEILIFFFILSE